MHLLQSGNGDTNLLWTWKLQSSSTTRFTKFYEQLKARFIVDLNKKKLPNQLELLPVKWSERLECGNVPESCALSRLRHSPVPRMFELNNTLPFTKSETLPKMWPVRMRADNTYCNISMLCASKELKYLPRTCWWLNKCWRYVSVSGELLPENLNISPRRPLASNLTFAKEHQSSFPPKHTGRVKSLCAAVRQTILQCPPLQFHMLDANTSVATKTANWFVYGAFDSQNK